MDDRTVGEQVISGFRITGLFLFGITTVATYWGGIIAIANPQEVGPNSFLFHTFTIGPFSFIAAWVCLLVSATILLLTMDHWAKILPGILIWMVCSSLRGYVLFSKHGKDPNEAVFVFLMCSLIATACVAYTFAFRKLRVFDRIALMAFLVSFGFAFSPHDSRVYWALSAGFVMLFLAMVIDQVQHREAIRVLNQLQQAGQAEPGLFFRNFFQAFLRSNISK
ncbi:MAG TPA: hypothetical protein VGN44_00030 [Candidatus Angelobacter sp.]|jgi:hypothetical protein